VHFIINYYLIMDKLFKQEQHFTSEKWVIYQLYCQTRRHW
jgi:hypothetical protein